MSQSPGQILIIRGGAIGDFILTLPALAALRAHLPKARLELLGYPRTTALALAGGLVDAARSIDAGPLAGFFARDGDLDRELRDYFAGFAIVVSYLYDPDEVFQTNVRRCSQAQFLVGPHRPDERGGVHAAEVFLQPLQRLAVFGADSVPRLTLATPSPAPQPPCLALHPGSGSERKNWPEPRWTELIQDLLRTTNWRLLLVGGEAEGDRLPRLASALPRDRVELANGVPLVELAARLARCAGFVGHDSGITHLAAAMGLPVLALWGDTVEAVWRPRGERVAMLRHPDGLGALPVTEVQKAVHALPLEGA